MGLKKRIVTQKNSRKIVRKKVVTQDLAEMNSHKTSAVGDLISNEIMKY
ncbi:MAG: hypothetical protein VXZ14_02185 [Bacteroidota bacterium]|nr:hypothetical protein [Bacteroidota bacterium]MEC8407349.1 hypothetical protein [Bacteroidota bacterium]